MLIAFEGCDGAGKATQAKLLKDTMETAVRERRRKMLSFGQSVPLRHQDVRLFSFPDYKGVAGILLKQYLKGKFGKIYDNHPLTVAALYAIDRAEHCDQLVGYLANGDVVICDRYVHSNVAYQAGKLYDASDDNWLKVADHIEQLEFNALRLPRPDIVFYLDVTAEQASERARKRDKTADIHQDDTNYLNKVRSVYVHYVRTSRGWFEISCFDGNRARSPEEIHEQVSHIVLTQFNL